MLLTTSKILLLLVLICLSLTFPLTAKAWHKVEYPTPSKVETYCPDNKAEFEYVANTLFGTTLVSGWTFMDSGVIDFAPDVCAALKKGPGAEWFPYSAAVLYHEWIHSYFRERGKDAEGNAECVSFHFYQYALVNWWHTSRAYARKA